MKKIGLIILLTSFAVGMSSCRETKSEQVKDEIEDVGDAVEDVGDAVEDVVDDN